MRRLIPLMLLAALPVWAQNDLQPLPAVPPPPPGMEAFDAVLEPQVTIVKADHQGDGNFIEANIPNPTTKPPMWILHSW